MASILSSKFVLFWLDHWTEWIPAPDLQFSPNEPSVYTLSHWLQTWISSFADRTNCLRAVEVKICFNFKLLYKLYLFVKLKLRVGYWETTVSVVLKLVCGEWNIYLIPTDMKFLFCTRFNKSMGPRHRHRLAVREVLAPISQMSLFMSQFYVTHVYPILFLLVTRFVWIEIAFHTILHWDVFRLRRIPFIRLRANKHCKRRTHLTITTNCYCFLILMMFLFTFKIHYFLRFRTL